MNDKQNTLNPKQKRKVFYIVRDTSHKSKIQRPLQTNTSTINIFDLSDSQMELYRFSSNQTPVGGRKIFQNFRKRIELPTQPRQTKENQTVQKKTPQERYRRKVNFEDCGRPATVNGNYIEECLKSDGNQKTQSSNSSFLTKQRSGTKTDTFYRREERSYHKKMGILGELDYRAPLEVKMGARYFELILRNRIDEQTKSMIKPFMYQIADREDEMMTCGGRACFQKALSKIRAQLNSPKPQYMQVRGTGKRVWQDV